MLEGETAFTGGSRLYSRLSPNQAVEQEELGIELINGAIIGGMLFANDFVGVSDLEEHLQKLIDGVQAYYCKWR